jgi:hypothetical protein
VGLDAGHPTWETSQISHEVFDFAQVARIAVRKTGRDFSEKMGALEKRLAAEGVIVFQVWLNLADPGNGRAVEMLRRSGYFIGGVLPHWFGSDGLLMQKILKAPDWDGIRLHSERARRILEKVQADWETVGKERK